jgi:hypothetical protein
LCLTALWAGSVVLSGCRSNTKTAQPTPPQAEQTEPTPVTPPPTTEVVSGSTPPPATAPVVNPSDIVARVHGVDISRGELEQPLIEAYGLNILLNLVQLDLAKQQAARDGLTVTPEDIRRERELTLAKLFEQEPDKEKYDQLLDQFLKQQHTTHIEFDFTVETNAYLRKIAEAQLPGKVTDEMVHKAFEQFYGENRQIRDIELASMGEVNEARRRIAAGQSFEDVARAMSLDHRTGALGGEWPPFSAQSQNIPQQIKDYVFSEKETGKVSETILVGTQYHLIKLINIIPPKIVKEADVKDSVRKTLEDQLVTLAIGRFRAQLGQIALQSMSIQEPVLRAQWQKQLDERNSVIRDRDSAYAEINRQRQAAAAASQPSSTTAPSSAETAAPTTAPTAAGEPPAAGRPPATMPGAAAPGIPSTQP